MATKTQSKVLQASVASDWLRGIVDSYFVGEIDHPTFDAKMRAAWDDIAARGLVEEVNDMWRLRAYGSK